MKMTLNIHKYTYLQNNGYSGDLWVEVLINFWGFSIEVDEKQKSR